MISRRQGLVGVLGLGLIVAVIWLVRMLGEVGSCMDPGAGGSCPTLADVNGVRYGVSVAHELVDIDAALSPFAPIGRTNVPDHFAEMTTFRILAIDPTAALAAPARAVYDEDVGPYRLLYGPNSLSAYPALCNYLPAHLRVVNEQCGAVPSS